MALVLGTRLKSDGEVYEEGTPLSKLKKKDKDLAKELGLLREEAPEEDEDEDEDEPEEAEEDTTEAEATE
jgi:hypothetical protein